MAKNNGKAALSTAPAVSLSTGQVASLSTEQLGALSTLDVATLSTTDLPALSTAPAAPLPAQVVLASPYGFYDDDQQLRMWQADQVVTDPEHIALLIARAAPLVA